MEEWVEIAKQLILGLLQRMGIETEVEGFLEDGDIYLKVKSDEGGILIGKHGRTLESLQILVNRMVNKKLKKPARIILDVADYKKKRDDSLKTMATRLGENAKRRGIGISIGPFSAHDRRIIHITLKEDPFLKTESLGDGEWKKVKIIPTKPE